MIVLHGCVASVYHQSASLNCEKILSLVLREGACGSSWISLSHRLSFAPGGSAPWSSSIPGLGSSHLTILFRMSPFFSLQAPHSSLSQQLQINRFFSNKAWLRLCGSIWCQVELYVCEGCILGGPRKLFLKSPIFKNCSSGKPNSIGLSSRYHCWFDFAASGGSNLDVCLVY